MRKAAAAVLLVFVIGSGVSADAPIPAPPSGQVRGKEPPYLGAVEKLRPVQPPEIYRHGSRSSRKVALTIDDGWVEDRELLDILDMYGIRCTVFLPGKVVAARPAWVKSLSDRGFEVANHSYSHRLLTYMSDAEIEDDVGKAQKIITRVTGRTYPYFRPSGGAVDERVLRVLARMGYIVIMWENDVLGYWKDRPMETQLAYIRAHRANGNIILSHFGSALRTAQVLRIIIPEMLAEGYQFVTVTELLQEMKTSGAATGTGTGQGPAGAGVSPGPTGGEKSSGSPD